MPKVKNPGGARDYYWNMTVNYKRESKGSTEHHLAVIASKFEASLLVGQMEPPVYIYIYILYD